MTIERFLAIVNKVTAYHRHGNNIPKEALDKLCNAQIELETKLQNTSSNSGYMAALNEILHNRLDCLEMVNVDKLIGLINEDIQRLNQRS